MSHNGIFLIALAIFLFIAEALPPVTFGLLAFAGAICMFLGTILLIHAPFPYMHIALNVILPAVLALAAIAIFLAVNVIKTHGKKSATGAQTLIGQTGVAQTDINETGQVFVDGEIWTAVNQSGNPIKKGEKIKVVGVDKTKLLVGR
jgi:membrane-bound serine protease (ClpP class)